MPCLAVLGPDRAPFSARLDNDEVTVGRSGANHLVLADPSVSRTHGRFFLSDGPWCFSDLARRHGSLINGRRVRDIERLEAGDRINLGQVVLVFEPPDEERCLRTTGSRRAEGEAPAALVGDSTAVAHVRNLSSRFAPSTATVLVQGETGTGKELVARLVHELSDRAEGPFVVVNCPALPGSLVEAELFGTERGTATGVDARPGLAETADGGTLFLDEIGDLEASAQSKLLRFLQDRRLRRVGARQPKAVDVRVIAATHHDLPSLVEEGRFRRDLFHRLEVATIHVPPLRERPEDIPALVAHFLDLHAEGRPRLEAEALESLQAHDWPGNVRELEHALQRAALLAPNGAIRLVDLPRGLRSPSLPGPSDGPKGAASAELHRQLINEGGSFWELVREPYLKRHLSREVVRELVERLVEESAGSYRGVAERVGCADQYRKLVDFLRNNRLRPEDPT